MSSLRFEPEDRGPGRALLVTPAGRLYAGRGFEILASDDDGASWRHEFGLPTPWKRQPARLHRLAARLLRYEIRALGLLSDGRLVAANRDWIYVGGGDLDTPRACRVAGTSDQRVFPPMTITVGPDDRVLWGEYDAETGHGHPIRLYASLDRGESFEVVHEFAGGEVLHVHSLLYDEKRGHYWVFAGDYDEEPGIGMLSGDLARFEWLRKGDQSVRVCEAFDFGDRLVYATDTPLAPNAICAMEKDSGRVEKIQPVSGSCLYAGRFADLCVFSTTIEPGAVDQTRRASLWASRDGESWEELLSLEKDRWHPVLQFGSMVVPRGWSPRRVVCFSGQAVDRFDGRLAVGQVETP